MATWQVNAARNHLSDVLDQADTSGPQIITHHGKERAVVLSIAAFRALEQAQRPDLVTFLLNSPKFDWDDSDLERDRSGDNREIPFANE